MILRDLEAAVGVLLVVSAGASVVGTVVVPRAFGSRLTACADWLVDRVFRGLERLIRDTQRRDDVLALRAATDPNSWAQTPEPLRIAAGWSSAVIARLVPALALTTRWLSRRSDLPPGVPGGTRRGVVLVATLAAAAVAAALLCYYPWPPVGSTSRSTPATTGRRASPPAGDGRPSSPSAAGLLPASR